YGTDVDVVGVFTGSLNNGGESIAFGHPVASMLEAFEYNDAGDWPNRADGGGSSLELIDIDGDHTAGSSWRSSSEYGGSPGLVGTGPRSDVVVNEVLTHSDDPLTDSIELYNTTGAPIDISGWFLSDGGPDYAKFEIPAGTVIPADGYVVFYEGHYVAGALEVDYATEFGGPGEKDFALSGARGDDVWLMEADASGNLLGFVDHVDFGAAINGESFGRWPDTLGDLYPMTS
ncbi:MAG: lamin tail domain-containing protein, partial [Phycisphaerae bacterium]|nr:lamin tail domain-containing protein [Phycisphaerae bacterium]